MQPLRNLNEGKRYADKLKPFNFLLTCYVKQLGHPVGVDPAHFHLIAPYETDPKKWLKMEWIDQYSGKRYLITTAGQNGDRHTARVKTDTIKSLSRKEVAEISLKFESLNPYDRDAVPGSILKIEKDNFDPETGKQRQLYCCAISAKRYALAAEGEEPVLVKVSEHGLGHLLNPTDPESDNRDWISQAWLNIIRSTLGHPKRKLAFENLPAIGRVTISSPAVMQPLRNLNEGKCYADKLKPFNFSSRAT